MGIIIFTDIVQYFARISYLLSIFTDLRALGIKLGRHTSIWITWGIIKTKTAASLKVSVSSKDNLIETRTKIIVGAMP